MISALIDGKEPPSAEQLEAGDALYGLSGILQLCALVAAAVVYIIWLFRVRANAEALSWLHHRHGKAWLILGWGVPIASLFIPKQIIDDIWVTSRPGTIATEYQRRPGLVRLWWASYLLYQFGFQIAWRIVDRGTDEDLESMGAVARLEVAAMPVGVVAAVLAAMVVWRISGFQELRRTAPMTPDAPESYPSH